MNKKLFCQNKIIIYKKMKRNLLYLGKFFLEFKSVVTDDRFSKCALQNSAKKCRFYSLMTTSWAVGVEVKLVPSVRRMYAR
jgi:hypothetical protein